jgi:ketosteroid isomerase-like protein
VNVDNAQQNFEQFMKQWEAASVAYINADTAQFNQHLTSDSPASFFGPTGDVIEGAERVSSKYDQDAKAFAPGSGEGHFEILHLAADGDLAYWVGFQHVNARTSDGQPTVPLKLRVTEVFRYEGEAWKLVHRHADALASKPESS